MTRIPLAACVAMALAAPAAAQTQPELNAQEAARHRRADVALNARYRVAMAEAKADGPASANALLASQRAWLRFRDAECARVGEQYRGGSMRPMQESGCLARLTEERTVQLRGDPR